MAALSLSLAACGGAVEDEAAKAGVGDAELIQAAVTGPSDDYFRAMDGGIELTPTERNGRIMWLLWTGGNDRFWNYMVEPTYGSFDLLKIVASEPASLNARPHRWQNL